jgi:threonine synthase
MMQQCIECRARYPLTQVIFTCPACGDLLEIVYEPGEPAGRRFEGQGVWRYPAFLPGDPRQAVTLGEGATGLHRCRRLGRELGIDQLHVKNEGENPTGSFKDRGMTVGVSNAIAIGARTVACASTGNTSASLAAYAARAVLDAIVLVPGGKVALGKMSQAIAHGARIVQIGGNFDDAMRLVQELCTGRSDVYLLNSINPFRLEGQKTAAFEICEALGDAPEAVVLPLGNAGNISAYWKGFREFHAAGLCRRLPRMIGVQAAGAAPIAEFLRDQRNECRMSDPQTIATAIRIGAPVSWKKAVAAIRESGGSADSVTDAEILAAQRELAAREGLFVEPSSAAPIAWLLRERPTFAGPVVCIATGHGLKDPDAVLSPPPRLLEAAPTLDSLKKVLGL